PLPAALSQFEAASPLPFPAPLRLSPPTLQLSVARTDSVTLFRSRMLPARATSPASPTASAHPTRRSCRSLRRALRLARRTRSRPASLPLHCAERGTPQPVPDVPNPAPATPGDLPFHGSSAAAHPDRRRLKGSCSPAVSPLNDCASR